MTNSRTELATKNILVLSSSRLIWKNGSIYTNKKIVFRNKQRELHTFHKDAARLKFK